MGLQVRAADRDGQYRCPRVLFPIGVCDHGSCPAAFLMNRFLRIVPLFVTAILMSCAVLYGANRFVNLTDEAGRSAIDPFATKTLNR